MVGLKILTTIRPDKRIEFLQAFQMLEELGQLGDSRIDLGLFEQITEANTFLWLEHWADDESLANYCLGTKFRAVLGAIDVMGAIVRRDTFFIKDGSAKA